MSSGNSKFSASESMTSSNSKFATVRDVSPDDSRFSTSESITFGNSRLANADDISFDSSRFITSESMTSGNSKFSASESTSLLDSRSDATGMLSSFLYTASNSANIPPYLGTCVALVVLPVPPFSFYVLVCIVSPFALFSLRYDYSLPLITDMSFCILGSVELLCICGTRITRTTRITRIIHDRRAMRGFSGFMMEVLKNVIGVLDMDGFEIDNVFFCKELGLLRVGDTCAKSYFFNIGVKWDALSERAKRAPLFTVWGSVWNNSA